MIVAYKEPEDPILAFLNQQKENLMERLRKKQDLLDKTENAKDGKTPVQRAGLDNEIKQLGNDIQELIKQIDLKEREILERQLKHSEKAPLRRSAIEERSKIESSEHCTNDAVLQIQDPLIRELASRLYSLTNRQQEALRSPEAPKTCFESYFFQVWEGLSSFISKLDKANVNETEEIVQDVSDQVSQLLVLVSGLTEFQLINKLNNNLLRVKKEIESAQSTIGQIRVHELKGGHQPPFYVGKLSAERTTLESSLGEIQKILDELISEANKPFPLA